MARKKRKRRNNREEEEETYTIAVVNSGGPSQLSSRPNENPAAEEMTEAALIRRLKY